MTWNKIVSGDFTDVGLLLIRLGIGPAFIAHGWSKLGGLMAEGASAGFVGMLGVFGGAALVVAWLVTLVELLGGIALLVGFASRIAGVLIAIVMASAMVMVKFKAEAGLNFLGGWELDLAFLTMGLLMLLAGPGRYSLERIVGVKA